MSGTEFKLRQCVWEITLACCFSCKYCGSRAGKRREDELTTEECLDVAAQLKELGCRRINLIGGEVFMREDWREIVSAITRSGIRLCIITNGYRLSGDDLVFLKRARIESVAVSLDGPRDVHDAWRMRGSFDNAAESVKRIAAAGIPVSVISALRRDNAAKLREFYEETVKKLPIFAWQLQACSPMGNAAEFREEVKFSVADVIKFVSEISGTAPFSVGVADNIGYFTPEETHIRGRVLYFPGCGAGLSQIGIDCRGNVTGCESMKDPRFFEGNVRRRRLSDIWNDGNAFSYNRKFTPELLSGKCADCPEGPYCAGGCRSYNFFTSDSLYRSASCARNRGPEESL